MNNWIKYLFSIILLMITPMALAVQWVDRIVIIVNEDVITERDIRDMTASLKQSLPKSQIPSEKALRDNAMSQLIDKKLILQLAKRNNVSSSESDIDANIAQIAANNKITVADFYKMMEKQGVSKETLRQTVGENIVIADVTRQGVEHASQVTNDEIARFLMQNPLPPTLMRYAVRHILLTGVADHLAQSQLQKWRKELMSGASFDAMAQKHSQDSATALNGGQLGWILPGTGEAQFDQAIVNLPIGEVSEPVKTSAGWHLLQVDDARQTPLSDEDRILLVRTYLKQQKAPYAYQMWIRDMREAAYIDFREQPY